MEITSFVELQPQGPIYTFDIGQGKDVPEGMALDLDETDYRTLCTEMARDLPAAADSARMRFTSRTYFTDGSVDHDSNEIRVGYTGNLDHDNNILRHETRHYLGRLRGESEALPMRVLGNLGIRTLPLTLPTVIGALLYEKLDPTAPAWVRVAAIAINGYSVVSTMAYFFHPG